MGKTLGLLCFLSLAVTGCGAWFNGQIAYSGAATAPQVTELVRRYPVMSHPSGMVMRWEYTKLARVDNPFFEPIEARLECNIFYYTLRIPGKTSQYVSVETNWRMAYVTQCHLVTWYFTHD
jgi:hypothetical protein